MWLSLLLSIQLIHLSSLDDANCYFTVFYSNGSRSWCLDEECSIDHVDIISLKSLQCRTNSLSLRFSSYLTYRNFLEKTSSEIPLSSFFSMGRPNLERLLQIEILSPLDNDNLFKLNQFHLLSRSASNIDTYQLIFNGNIAKKNFTLFIDREMFLSAEQDIIDTLRIEFNCNENERVEWELVRSIENLPQSPCPEQITFIQKDSIQNTNIIMIILIVFLSIIIILIFLFFFYKFYFNNQLKEQTSSSSQTELISVVQRF